MNSIKKIEKFEKLMNSESMNDRLQKLESEYFKKDNVRYVKVNHPKFPEMVMIEKVPSVLKHMKNKKFVNLDKAMISVNKVRSEQLIKNNPIVVDYSPII